MHKNIYVMIITLFTRSFLNISTSASKYGYISLNRQMACFLSLFLERWHHRSAFIFTLKKNPLSEKHLPDIWQDRFNIRIHSQGNSFSREIIILSLGRKCSNIKKTTTTHSLFDLGLLLIMCFCCFSVESQTYCKQRLNELDIFA